MIEAVIWDFGGVFTTSPFEAFARYERERGIPVGTIRKINSTNHEEGEWEGSVHGARSTENLQRSDHRD